MWVRLAEISGPDLTSSNAPSHTQQPNLQIGTALARTLTYPREHAVCHESVTVPEKGHPP
jgi:hypothetical protein